MTVAALILAALAAVAALLAVTALLELFENVKQLREFTGLSDRPVEFDVSSLMFKSPSSFALPDRLDRGSGIVLFVSASCRACHTLVSYLATTYTSDETWPTPLTVIVTNTEHALAAEWFAEAGLSWNSFRLFDENSKIAKALGIDATPVALFVEGGQIERGVGVPSARWLASMLPEGRVFKGVPVDKA